MAYLQLNRKLLQDREDGKFCDEQWYRFGRTQNLGIWEQAKLLVPYMVTRLAVYLDIEDHFYFINVTTGGYGITAKRGTEDLPILCALLNSSVCDFWFKCVTTPFRGGYFAANKQFIENLPVPDWTSIERSAIEQLVDHLLFLHRQPTVRESIASAPRDPLIAQYFEQWVNAMVYQLFFPEELRTAQLDFFNLLSKANLASVDKDDRLNQLRRRFEDLYDPSHPLRGALFALQSLELVRTIEGEE